jgi:hypothetical protein
MASGPTLPPQAYTREILTAAFNWLQTQPESAKKLATTPDALVGLYMRAQRFGNSNLETDAPVSSQHFMSDLKNLAEGLKQFEDPRQAELRRSAALAAAQQFQQQQLQQQQQVPVYQAMHQPPLHQHQVQHPHPQQAPVQPQSPAQTSPHNSSNPGNGFSGMNERSWTMIQEVKAHFNLSSDGEAINMMLALAYKSLKNLLV